MSEISHNLSLPFIQPSQAQKHVTHNEALRLLDAVVQLTLQSLSQQTPPSLAIDGQGRPANWRCVKMALGFLCRPSRVGALGSRTKPRCMCFTMAAGSLPPPSSSCKTCPA